MANPPETEPLRDSVVVPFIDAVRGRRFGEDDAILVSRWGNTDYQDHPLQWLEFSAGGKSLLSYCPCPDDSDASVAGPFRLKQVDANNNYVVELEYGCKTTFIPKRKAIELPMKITCQRSGCPQRHRTRFLEGFHDFDELSGQRTIGDPGVVELKRCSRCRQVHYCSVACQRADWRQRHRIECNNFGRTPFPDIDSASAGATDLKAVLMHIFRSCITSGEERSWGFEGIDRAKQVGRRLYEIGGKDLCVSVCDGLREELSTDRKRSSDAGMLECVWADPVVPGWWP